MFFILLFIILVSIIIWNSKIQINISNLDISTERKEIIKKNLEIYISLIAFNKIEILKIDARKLKSKNINLGTVLEKAKKLQIQRNTRGLLKDLALSLKDFKFEIKKANLELGLGTENAATTAILVGIIGSILGIILKGQKIEIKPIYQDENILNLKLNCIFRVNLIHYIYKTILKGREKNERKSSDRRSYVYSHE